MSKDSRIHKPLGIPRFTHAGTCSRTVSEFIAFAKANPGKLNMGSGGIGSIQHVSGELFKMMTGVNIVHVPYRGGAPAIADLLGGQVQVIFDPVIESIGYITAGRLRPLAVTTAMRSEALPDLPTVGDFVPGYETSGWFGVGVPRNTPVESSTSSTRRSMQASPIPS